MRELYCPGWRTLNGEGAGAPHKIVEVLAGHAASGVYGKVYEHRELLPLLMLRDGLEKLTYPAVVETLVQHEKVVSTLL